ncbi:RraA family protein [Paraburkholderia phosphatilytica]|uniref:RraA family protein n=1 Tax=Paraburkholderia phosphatilytica TaxID=2282883 RepID=UPI000E51B49D|nr:RraA family protein [Paraburkholderia phosphatilytica]
MPIGFRILERKRAVSADVVKRFASVSVACISDVMTRLTAGGPRLRPMHAGSVLCGPAFTVKSRPGDNLMVHKALTLAQPGDVIVVDAGGDLTNAIIGELMVSYAMARGLGGMVIDGAIRDSDWIGKHDMPVYAAGVTHRGPYKDGPGEINVPVAFDGMLVEPGDLIVGDADGFVCVPYDDVETVYAMASKKSAGEVKILENTLVGKFDDKSWIDESLRRLGCDGV